ncbi:MAG: nucleotidyltransferase [Bacteroidetes bacterium]|nr:nucleotidyltransferase [Bacteroidota bacterium]
MLAPVITDNINQIKALCEQHKVKELFVFGSAVSERFNEQSDVDLVVEFWEMDINTYADNYFDFIEKLENLLGRKVDLITAKYLKNRIFIRRLEQTKQKLFAA